MASIRVVTLNLQGLDDVWFVERERTVVEGLRGLRPDVIALQEVALRHVSGHDNEGRLFNQARAIGDALGLEACAYAPYGNPIEVVSPELGGIATLSRFPLRSVRSRRLPAGHTNDNRVALVASLATPFGELTVVNTHLSWRPEESEVRLVQLGLVLDEFVPAPWQGEPARVILAGDLNACPDEPVVELTRGRLQDAWRAARGDAPGYTWATRNGRNRHPHLGDRRLDYLFAPPAARVLSCEVVLDEPRPVWASDHFGVLAEIEWP